MLRSETHLCHEAHSYHHVKSDKNKFITLEWVNNDPILYGTQNNSKKYFHPIWLTSRYFKDRSHKHKYKNKQNTAGLSDFIRDQKKKNTDTLVWMGKVNYCACKPLHPSYCTPKTFHGVLPHLFLVHSFSTLLITLLYYYANLMLCPPTFSFFFTFLLS